MFKNNFTLFRLQRFEKTNEMLTNCNALSQSRLKNVTEDYRKNCKLLLDMKKDLGGFKYWEIKDYDSIDIFDRAKSEKLNQVESAIELSRKNFRIEPESSQILGF